eukprot:468070_1
MCIILIVSNSINNSNFIDGVIIRRNKKMIWFIFIWFTTSLISFIIFIVHRDITVNKYIISNQEFTFILFVVGLVIILPFFIPLFWFLILTIICKIFHINMQITSSYDTFIGFETADIFDTSGEIEMFNTSGEIELGESLLSVTKTNNNDYNITIAIINIILFYILLLISCCNLFMFKVLYPSFIADNFEFVIWTFFITTSLLKKITKRIARNIDRYRKINHSMREYMHNSTKHADSFISINYLMEAYFSVYYYSFTKSVVAKSPSFSTRSMDMFIYLLVAHFMTEIIETNLMFSECYFNQSAKILNFIEQQANNDIFGFRILHKIFCNKSNLIQWRSRLSMDVFARFCCSLICSIMYLVRFICYGKQHINNEFGHNFFQKSVTLTIIYGAQDVVHYCLTIIYVHKCFRFNMLSQFVEHFDQMMSSHLFFLVIVYLLMFVSLYYYCMCSGEYL